MDSSSFASTPQNGREFLLSLTHAGRVALEDMQSRSDAQSIKLLDELAPGERTRLLAGMARIEAALGSAGRREPPLVLRPHRAGDIGWVVSRHAETYSREYGWDASFEALVAEIGARFLREFDSARECCWIAEVGAERVGCALVVRESASVAKLRLVLVDGQARGRGVGGRLLGECIGFARRSGYSTMTLWTNDVLHAARRMYEAAGFCLVDEAPDRA